jgi:hypothetical protein
MQYETNRRLLATSQRAFACLVSVPRLQLAQSFVRKCSASADHWVPFSEHGYVGRSAARFSAYCERQSVCFIFCRGRQRDHAKHSGHQQSGVAGHNHDCRDLRCWDSKRDGEYSEWKLRRCWLHERWNQPSSRLDDHLKPKQTRKGTERKTSSLLALLLGCHSTY